MRWAAWRVRQPTTDGFLHPDLVSGRETALYEAACGGRRARGILYFVRTIAPQSSAL